MSVPCLRLARVGVLIALCGVTAGLGAQIPPSVRAPAPAPAPPQLSPADFAKVCVDLRDTIALLKKDPVWLRQPYSQGEVRDVEALIKQIKCEIAFEGTWQVTGTVGGLDKDEFPGYTESFTMVVQKVDTATGLADSEKQFGPARTYQTLTCRGADVYYNGTMTYASPRPAWGSLRTAKFSVCGNTRDTRGLLSGRFGAVQPDGGISTKLGGAFILSPGGPGEMSATVIYMDHPDVSWRLKKAG